MSTPTNLPQESPNCPETRRCMITGGLFGWGMIGCIVVEVFSDQGMFPETFCFIIAFILMQVVTGFLTKKYRLESMQNPNSNLQERERVSEAAHEGQMCRPENERTQ